MGPKPTFERWAYWEKFDFWGAAADIVIIGSTGMILWFPVWFCQYLPGEAVNISKVIHSTQALLAIVLLFAGVILLQDVKGRGFRIALGVLGLAVSSSLATATVISASAAIFLSRARTDPAPSVPDDGKLRAFFNV